MAKQTPAQKKAKKKYRESEKGIALYKSRYENTLIRAKIILSGIRRRSAVKSLDCDLTIDWLVERFTSGVCEVTGIPLNFATHGVGSPTFYSPSVDRINNLLGYTQDNCRVVIHGYNVCKGTATDADVLYMAQQLLGEHLG